MEESWWHKWKVVRKWKVIVWKGILFLFSVSFSTMLTARVFLTQDTVSHPRRFVFGKFVRKPNCSWSEAFVNRGLTVRGYIWQPAQWEFYSLLTCLKGVFVTRETVRHLRRFVYRKFVHKPNCSWSEAFVNRGLTVLGSWNLSIM